MVVVVAVAAVVAVVVVVAVAADCDCHLPGLGWNLADCDCHYHLLRGVVGVTVGCRLNDKAEGLLIPRISFRRIAKSG